mgnify:CR=1 FL=1
MAGPDRDFSPRAVETGIDVVSDFRRKDIALGGQGAPLVPAFHQFVFSSNKQSRVVINLGGIANLTFLPKQQACIGYDIGPANTLIDHWYRRHNKGQYDNHGNWARTGEIHQQLLQKLIDDPYFQKAYPKSTGPEYFNIKWLLNYLTDFDTIKAEDVQATLIELSAYSISAAIKSLDSCEEIEVFLCGGGCHNYFLIERINSFLEQIIQTTKILGLAPDQVESAAFAWLAKQRIEGKTGNLNEATGASKPAILGGLYLAG